MNTKISSERTYRKVYKAVMEALEPVRKGSRHLVHGTYGHPNTTGACLVGTLGLVNKSPDILSGPQLAKLNSISHGLPVQKLIHIGIDPKIAPNIVEALEGGFENWAECWNTNSPLWRYYSLGRRISKKFTPSWEE